MYEVVSSFALVKHESCSNTIICLDGCNTSMSAVFTSSVVTTCVIAMLAVLAKNYTSTFQDIFLGIEACFTSLRVADRAACDTLLKVFIMTAATYDLSTCLCEYDTKKSLQVSYPVTQLPSTHLPSTQLQLPSCQLPLIQLPMSCGLVSD